MSSTVVFSGGNALGKPGSLLRSVVTVATGELWGKSMELTDPGTEPVSEHPQRVGGTAQSITAGGAIRVMVDGVEQARYAAASDPPLVE